MAATKAIGTDDKREWKPGETRTYEEALNAPPEPATPTQEELDAMKTGEEIEPPPPEGETAEAKAKREENARKKREEREAKAAADQQASYQTRNA
jgi:hypothetical protein